MTPIDARDATQKIRDGEVLIAALDQQLALICDARNSDAVKLLRKLKNRPPEKGFSILIDSDARLNRYVHDVPPLAWDIIDTAEGPIILVLPGGKLMAREALAQDGTIAVRMVTCPEEQKLVQMANAPLACTALTGTNGKAVSDIEDADPTVLSAVEYVLSLPTSKNHYAPATVPVIGLELDGGVKIIRS